MNENKFSITTLVVLFFILVIGSVCFYFLPKDKNKDIDNTPKSVLTDTKYFQEEKLPNSFPPDLPREKGAQILQNFTSKFATKENNVRTPDGKLATVPEFYQSTYSFVSEKSIGENYDIYKKYFESKKDYKLHIGSISESIAILTYSIQNKQNQTFSFEATIDPATKKIIVTLDKIYPIISFENGKIIQN